MFVDFYKLLEVPIDATNAEIVRAFKNQAKKWHPDKNIGIDTTERMKLINIAKYILCDEEARELFNIEYKKFVKFEQKKQECSQSNNEDSAQNVNEEYEIEDENLTKWIENARKQSIIHLQNMLLEFRDSSYIGFYTFIDLALKGIIISIIYILIVQIFKFIFS